MGAPKKDRAVPTMRKAVANQMGNVDTTGMDPAMAATIRQDAGRRVKVAMVTKPAKQAAKDGESFMAKVFSVFHPKGK